MARAGEDRGYKGGPLGDPQAAHTLSIDMASQ